MMITSSKTQAKHKVSSRASIRTSVILATVAITGTLLVAGTKAASIVTADALHLTSPTPAIPEAALFAMTIPGEPNKNQVLEIKPTESAFMSIATMNADVPLANWEGAGWKIGSAIGAAEAVPPDCALHSRRGIPRQLYAACPGPLTVSIPKASADFVYVVLTGSNNQIARVLRTGTLYNPDTSGLIP
jgi:hypothetical protein